MCHKHHSQQWSLIGSHRRGNVQENRAEVGWVDRTTQACELKKSCTSAGLVPLIGPRIVDTRRAADGGWEDNWVWIIPALFPLGASHAVADHAGVVIQISKRRRA